MADLGVGGQAAGALYAAFLTTERIAASHLGFGGGAAVAGGGARAARFAAGALGAAQHAAVLRAALELARRLYRRRVPLLD